MAIAARRIFSPLAGLRRTIGDWWRRLMTLRELDQCDDRDLQRVLHDLNVSKAELTGAVRRGPYPKLLLPRMLHALGLPADRIKAMYPSVASDLGRVCAQCPETARCRRELDGHTASAAYREFCLNSTTLEALQGDFANEAERAPDEEVPSVVQARRPN
ncbi:MAG TPA: hypothetical protein VMO81_14625 [Aestuariivirgaceae bacterium]|nr:hypothetical protein [Aestuariivirgaceae bacterium]